VKLLDLGLALLRNEPEVGTLTNAGAILGTPDYIAPEQAHDSRRVDIRSDLYSLGCTFYYLLAGRPPFEGGSAVPKLFRHCFEGRAPLEAVRPVPPGVAAVVRKLMAKQPADRFQSPAELVTALADGALLNEPRGLQSRPLAPRAVLPVRSRSER